MINGTSGMFIICDGFNDVTMTTDVLWDDITTATDSIEIFRLSQLSVWCLWFPVGNISFNQLVVRFRLKFLI